MHTTRQTAIKESKMKITTSKLIRWSGLSAMVAGIIFMAIQPFHPADVLSSVNTSAWAITTSFKTAMSFFGILGIMGIYARQVEKAGWLGLIGFLLFSLFYALQMCVSFIEPLILPLLTTTAPQFVESFLKIPSGTASGTNLGALPIVYQLSGFLGYMLGGLLFGIATFRARVLPRWAGALLAIGTILPLLMSSLLPHPYDRILAIPVGLALAWLGYALLSERREQVSETVSGKVNAQILQAETK